MSVSFLLKNKGGNNIDSIEKKHMGKAFSITKRRGNQASKGSVNS